MWGTDGSQKACLKKALDTFKYRWEFAQYKIMTSNRRKCMLHINNKKDKEEKWQKRLFGNIC